MESCICCISILSWLLSKFETVFECKSYIHTYITEILDVHHFYKVVGWMYVVTVGDCRFVTRTCKREKKKEAPHVQLSLIMLLPLLPTSNDL
jgi:hypothetical protein